MTNDRASPADGSSWFLAPPRSDPHDRLATTEIDLNLTDRHIQEEYEPKVSHRSNLPLGLRPGNQV
jgi:hypothetical protein